MTVRNSDCLRAPYTWNSTFISAAKNETGSVLSCLKRWDNAGLQLYQKSGFLTLECSVDISSSSLHENFMTMKTSGYQNLFSGKALMKTFALDVSV